MRKWAKWFGAGSTSRYVLPDGPVDLLADDVVADPYPLYSALRESRPLAELSAGGFLLTRHADIRAALSDKTLGNAPSRFSALAAKNRTKYTAADLAANIPPFLDMPEHRLPRQALSRAFFDTFKAHQARLPALAEQSMTALPAGRVELITAVSRPFALRSMADFVGLDAEPARLKAMTQAFFHLFAPITDPEQFRTTNAQLDAARDLIAGSLDARRDAQGDDLISAMLRWQGDDSALTDAMIVDNALLVFADGIENIEAGAASVLHRLAGQDTSSSTEAGVREALRLNTPGQIIPRVAREATELHGRAITAGTPVFLALGSGNVDGEAISDPLSFRPDRADPVLTFGLGRHRCIGEQLGIAQLTALMDVLHARKAEPVLPDQPLHYVRRFGHRWPERLEITVS